MIQDLEFRISIGVCSRGFYDLPHGITMSHLDYTGAEKAT